jgi:TatD DNase family protein
VNQIVGELPVKDASVMRLVDAHCHLEDEEFDQDRDYVVERARESGVVSIVTSSLNSLDASKALAVGRNYPDYVYVCIGSNPSNLDLKETSYLMSIIEKHRSSIVGVGEVGLDYYWVRENQYREIQRSLFREWIRFVEELRLPLIVHSRSAGKYAVQILLETNFRQVLMHAFDGRIGWAAKAAREGVYFSIPTSVWHSRQKQKLVKELPLDSLLVESDSPVLSPIEEKRNEPANLVYAVRRIAELKGVSEDEVAEKTTVNARKFFNLKTRNLQ